MRVKLGIGPLYPKQDAFVHRVGNADTGKISTHFQAGRGTGKTLSIGLKMWLSMTLWNPGCWHLVTYPTYRDVVKTFLPMWKKLVPAHLWHYHKTEHVISLTFDPDTQLHLYSRENPDALRGPEFAVAAHDEPASDKSLEALDNASACVRQPCPHPFEDSGGTPKLGLFSDYVSRSSGKGGECTKVIQATSFENPYRNELWLEGMAESYDPDKYRQEILGEIISLSGMAWKNFIADKRYPAGNRHWEGYNPELPFHIAVDPGLTSGWGIIQRYPAEDEYGHRVDRGGVDNIVAEYTPNGEDTRSTLMRIKADYPYAPASISTGMDVETGKSYVEGSKISNIIKDIWPGVPIKWPSGPDRYKSEQYDRLNGLICNYKGRRKLLVSEKIKNHEGINKGGRGVLQVMAQDQFPDKAPRRGEYLPKDGRLEHCRDYLMYWAVCNYRNTH